MRVVRLDDLYPDGLPFSVDWDNWEVGMSVFVPCIHMRKLYKQLNDVAKRKNYIMTHQTCIENQYLGVRIWRTA